jgi:hypothetical protein
MKKWLIAAAIVASGLFGSTAHAQQPCNNCGTPAVSHPGFANGGYGHAGFGHSHLAGHPLFNGNHPFNTHPIHGHPWFNKSGNITKMPTLPVYMAAPWYLYWPYDGHFQTVAPQAAGIYYPPPQYIGNPYLVGGYGGGYMPGNPAPRFPVPPAP